jgi:UTP--glucose-1-phosphate uridylyltransferase
MSKITKAVITAAGFGSRFLPITKTFPKELLPILEKPIIQYLVEECAEAEIEEVIIVAQEGDIKTFEDYFYSRSINIRTLMIRQNKLDRWNKVERVFELPKITIIPQDDRIPYGNGRPLISAKELLVNEESFVLLFGDDLFLSKESGVNQLIKFYTDNPSDDVLAVQEVPLDQVTKFGVVKPKPESENEIETIIEKPSKEEAPSNLCSYGRYIFTNKIFEYLNPQLVGKDGEVWLQDANDKLIQDGGKLLFTKLSGTWYTTGDPLNHLKASLAVALANDEYSKDVQIFLQDLLK